MSVYVVAHVQVHDASGYAEYACAFRREFPPGCGVQVIAADDAALPLEGAWPHVRTVILRFEDADAAVRWNDAAFAIDWPVSEPSLSDKDAKAPFLADIPDQRMPVYVE